MTPLNRRHFALALAFSGAAGLATSPAQAQAYPSKPIKIVVGFAAGGLTDILARTIAPVMSDKLGQPVIIDNKPGANGNISTAFVAGSEPDGHTLLFSSSAQIVYSPNTYKKLPADPINGLRHLSLIGEGDFIFVASTGTGVHSLAEFVTLAKSKPGALNYATSGPGGSLHVVQEIFLQHAGIQMVPVHYKGSSAALTDLVANQVQLFCDGLPSLEPYIKTDKLKPLFVTAKKRLPALPNVPTAAEVKLADLSNISNWFGLHAPKGTSDATVAKIQGALAAAMASESVKEKMRGLAIEPVFSTPAEFVARIDASNKLIGAAARAANIQID
ncbi:Bug family tripartite tricarboxylate transporter substrate binding protein [Pseudorhodoferax sp.]|uniref:Bug family tripartite tricarboxylate transporter substrate binding protein n=1 Tax=Pseudorhodoferax sp. TaxID=1993553 RepID=UPI0039E34054